MAELNVQPKKKTSFLPWLLLLLGVAALIWFFATRNKSDDNAAISTTKDTAVTATTVPASSSANTSDWDSVDFNAPAANYDEITDKNIDVRGNNNYGIYGLGENILFDEGKAEIRKDAEANLKQVTASISKRFANADVRIYGYTDATGSAGANKELAQQRADAVKTWFQNNGIEAAHISENAIGEANPVATNSTEAGRKQNRRVEIVARSAK